jgi:hypothetical protein
MIVLADQPISFKKYIYISDFSCITIKQLALLYQLSHTCFVLVNENNCAHWEEFALDCLEHLFGCSIATLANNNYLKAKMFLNKYWRIACNGGCAWA